MEQELIEINICQLDKEFEVLGLKQALLEEVNAELLYRSGEKFSLPFEMKAGCSPVKGKIFFANRPFAGLYSVDYYSLTLGRLPASRFHCTPWLMIRVDEAINLLEGRYVYRRPEADPLGEGYWLCLGRSASGLPPDGLEVIRRPFSVRDYLTATGTGSWLGFSEWRKLVSELEKGHRCELAIGTGKGMKAVTVEADPLEYRLRVRDGKGVEVGM